MPKKFVATILDRIFLGDDNYLFIPSHTVIGTLDPKSHILKDRNGSEYLPITEPCALQSEVSKGYCNLEDMYKIPDMVGINDMTEAIAEYHYYCNRFLYYVSKTIDGNVFCMPIDFFAMKEKLNRTIEEAKKQGGLGKVSEMNEQTEESTEEPTDDDSFGDNPLLSEDVNPNVASFMMDLMNGLYSLDDLREIKRRIENQRDDIDSLIDSIDLQIEASENGESSIRLKGEEAIPKRPVRREATPRKIIVPHYMDIEGLFSKITKTLIAQDEPTRRVLTEIARKEQSELNNDRGLLITGPTGSGKTKLMELIARYLDRPFLKIDSTQLTVPGYVGKDIEEELWKLYIKCGRDLEKTERAIVFFDEIDKKGSSNKDDISGKGVLNVLLPFFDGATYDACENMKFQKEVVPINTRNMLVILGGAFEDVYKELTTKGSIGFASTPGPTERTRKATTQDFVEKAKMPSEFMGRVAIIKLNDLTLEDIKRILLESDESALHIQERLFKELGVKLTPSEDYINAIAEQAMERKTGARGLNTVVDESTWEAYGDAYTHLGEYEEIILGKETVTDPKCYQKVLRKRSK